MPLTANGRPDAVKNGRLLIAAAACDECLFSKNKIVSERRKREVLRECYEQGTYFICHKATMAGRAVICCNFAKSTDGAGNATIRVATFFDAIDYVDPATGKPAPTKQRPAPEFMSLREAFQVVDHEAKSSRSKPRSKRRAP